MSGKTRAALNCEIVTEFEQLQESITQFESCRRTLKTEIFQTAAWTRAWWRAYGPYCSLCAPVVYDGEKVLGILPLTLRGDRLQFLGSPGSDYNDILCDDDLAPEVMTAAFRGMLQRAAGWRNCMLDNVSADSKIVRHLGHLRHEFPGHLQLVFKTWCPAIALSNGGDQLLDNLIRKESLRRHENKLRRLGPLTFEHLEDKTQIRAHLETFFRQHIARNAISGRRSQFLQAEQRQFFTALLQELDARHQLRFGVLAVAGRPIAYHFGFESAGKFIWYKPTFDVDLWDHSPGEVLLRSLLQYTRERRLREFDFTVGDEAFKNRFANHRTEGFTLFVHRTPIACGVLVERGMRAVQHAVRKRPPLLHFIGRQRRRIEGFVCSLRRIRKKSIAEICQMPISWLMTLVWWNEEILLLSPTHRNDLRFDVRNLQILPGSLSTLASLSIEYPDLLTPAKLQRCRERLKKGETAYIASSRGVPLAIAWLGPSEGMVDLFGHTGTPQIVAYELWIARGTCTSAILAALKQYDPGLWIRCLRRDLRAFKDIDQAGFQLQSRVRQSLIFRHFRWSTVLEENPPISNLQQQSSL